MITVAILLFMFTIHARTTLPSLGAYIDPLTSTFAADNEEVTGIKRCCLAQSQDNLRDVRKTAEHALIDADALSVGAVR